MSVAPASMMKIASAADPKKAILDMIGAAVEKTEVMMNNIMIATYIEPEKTAGGIIKVHRSLQESIYQGKCYLVLKCGPIAYKNDARNDFAGQNVKPGDWVIVRNSDGLDLQFGVDRVACKFVEEAHIRAIVPDPSLVY